MAKKSQLFSTQAITLSDEFDKTTLELFAVNESLPELEETYEISLMDPEGGASLGRVNKRLIRILPNDSPYGLITILPLHENEGANDKVG